MEQHGRKADGRRVYSPQFRREQVTGMERAELTLAELSRELASAGRSCSGGRPGAAGHGDGGWTNEERGAGRLGARAVRDATQAVSRFGTKVNLATRFFTPAALPLYESGPQ
jgi:hypothetical protein